VCQRVIPPASHGHPPVLRVDSPIPQSIIAWQVVSAVIGLAGGIWMLLTIEPIIAWGLVCLPPLSPPPVSATTLSVINITTFLLSYVAYGLTYRSIRTLGAR
jgi:drug/metabolite transporter (DMT)-like permease